MASRYARAKTYVRNNYYAGSRGKGFGRRFYVGNRKGTMGVKVGTPFLLGALAAFAVPQNTDIDMAALMIGTAPVRGLGAFKGGAQGYVFGQALQHWLLPKAGIVIPDLAGSALSFGSSSVRSGNVI